MALDSIVADLLLLLLLLLLLPALMDRLGLAID
jgi:hypothetical protein